MLKIEANFVLTLISMSGQKWISEFLKFEKKSLRNTFELKVRCICVKEYENSAVFWIEESTRIF